MLTVSAIGPVFAFVVGGVLLDYYTHFDTVDTSTLVHPLNTLYF